MKPILIAILLFSATPIAHACSCNFGIPTCKTLFETRAVFVGRVESVTATGGSMFSGFRARFHITEAIRGTETRSAIEVATGSGWGDCGYPFEVGNTYLVFAHGDSLDALSTGSCTGTQPIENAQDALEEVRQLVRSRQGGSITGLIQKFKTNVIKDELEAPEPLKGVTVQLKNHNDRLETKSSPDGKFQFFGVPPGTYEISAELPEGIAGIELEEEELPSNERTLAVSHGSCDSFHFKGIVDGRISGMVKDRNGIPVQGMAIVALPKDHAGKETEFEGIDDFTGEDGSFELKRLPPGAYILKSVLKQSGMSKLLISEYFSAATSVEYAQVFDLAEGASISDVQILLAGLETFKFKIRVEFSDGKPAKSALVNLHNSKTKKGYVIRGLERVDEDGENSYQVPNIGRYSASAEVTCSNRVMKLGAMHIPITFKTGKHFIESSETVTVLKLPVESGCIVAE